MNTSTSVISLFILLVRLVYQFQPFHLLESLVPNSKPAELAVSWTFFKPNMVVNESWLRKV